MNPKNLIFVLMLAGWLTTTACGQPADNSQFTSYQLGSRAVRIPAPEGFVDAGTTLDQVIARIRSAEAPENEVLTILVPKNDLPKYKAEQVQDIVFYSKIGVLKKTTTYDTSPERFLQHIDYIDKQNQKGFDPDGSIVKNAQENSSKALTKVWGEVMKVDISKPVIIGTFDRSPTVYSTLMRLSVSVNGRLVPLLAASTILYVNQRILFLNTYKMNPVQEDLITLRDHSMEWSSAIIAANQ